MNNQEVVGFICQDCKKEIAIGACGNHRLETGHKDFNELRGSR